MINFLKSDNGQLLVSYEGLTHVFSLNTIESWVKRNQVVHIQDEKDGRKRWVVMKTIPSPSIKRLTNHLKSLPEFVTLTNLTGDKLFAGITERLKDEKYDQAIQCIIRELPEVPVKDEEYLRNYRIVREDVDLETGEVFPMPKAKLSEERIKQHRLTARFLSMLTDKRYKDKNERAKLHPDFADIHQFRKAVLEASRCMSKEMDIKVALPNDLSRLRGKLKAYKDDGAECLINKQTGKRHAAKLTAECVRKLIELMSDSRKPTKKQVHGWFNAWRQERGMEKVGLRTIGQKLDEPDIEMQWWGVHHGMDRWKVRYEYTNWKQRATARDLKWVGDGTKVNYFYLQDGKVTAKLDVYEIVDEHSEMKLGWAFSVNGEDARVIQNALRMALQTSGNMMPYQMLYDGDSANKLALQGKFRLDFNAAPYNAQSKIIESMFARQQQFIMTRNHFFTGQNVKARSERGRLNQDRIKDLGKRLPSLEEVMKIYEEDNHLWNNTPQERDGKSPAQRYKESKCPSPRPLHEEDYMRLFWEYKGRNPTGKLLSWKEADTIKYRKDGILLQWGNDVNRFEVLDKEGNPDFDFHQHNINRSFKVKYDPKDLDRKRIALYDAKDERFVRWADEKFALPSAVYDQKPGDRAIIEQRLSIPKRQRDWLKEEARKRKNHFAGDTEQPWIIQNKQEQAEYETEMLTSLIEPKLYPLPDPANHKAPEPDESIASGFTPDDADVDPPTMDLPPELPDDEDNETDRLYKIYMENAQNAE